MAFEYVLEGEPWGPLFLFAFFFFPVCHHEVDSLFCHTLLHEVLCLHRPKATGKSEHRVKLLKLQVKIKALLLKS